MDPKLYLAPMEGLTTYIYRDAVARFYGGMDAGFTPFIVGPEFSTKERNEVLPEHNANSAVVPQILTHHADEFLHVAHNLRDLYGYTEVNLNLGCPSGTVVSKNRGSGFLRVLDKLEAFLDEIYSGTDMKISIKTRTGVDNSDNFSKILELYNKYPLSELIIHPRYQKQFYKESPDPEMFRLACEISKHPLVYNGDVNSKEDYERVITEFPNVKAVMCGRGVIRRPWLFSELGGENADKSYETMFAFMEDIYQRYREAFSGDKPTLFKMKEIWSYFYCNFENGEKVLRKVHKCQRLADYEGLMAELKGRARNIQCRETFVP